MAIWHAILEQEASCELLTSNFSDTIRTLYVFDGGSVVIAGEEVEAGQGVVIRNDIPVTVSDSGAGSQILILPGVRSANPSCSTGPS